MSSFGQIEQSAHYVVKSLINSMRKVFLECAVVEVVYKFYEKYYCECLKRYNSNFFLYMRHPQDFLRDSGGRAGSRARRWEKCLYM